ncbi:putative oxidoreductase UxuB [Planococcus massiliensis]|uniref:Putative oxidoreductase UxuB n=1 Tax=Planococcus massiliensis TaxID=1499687 RepID=A0A098EQ70_9BACL|nr:MULTISPECIES: SDR family oxidoreductase [Planococcus]MCJ1909865.1 SDR family oxidoreductase [Planococcus ruber]CEG23922.1 putative oxidoreductase UxuB [Planococcus massiliensis]
MIPIHENLKGRTAVITGGSGVLCSAMARELARHGVKVAILNRTAEKGKDVAEEINAAGGEALAVAANVLDRASLEEAKAEILKAFGKIDILINGAGGNHPDAITGPETYDESAEGKSFFDLEEEGFSNVFSVNFTGTFLASQVFGKELLKSEFPAIVNLSSMSSYAPMTKVPAYSAAKASINNFTMWMAVHFAETGLRVNSIAPGFFLTTQNRDLLLDPEGNPTSRSKKILTATPMKKFGQPEDLLGALLFLVDESYSSFVTGTTLAVDGGFMAYSGV